MCNLYSQKNSLQEVRDWFRVDVVDASAGNLPPLNSIFPGYDAPVIYRKKSERILGMMKWGFVLIQKERAPKYINNCRGDNVKESVFWKPSFKDRRCLVPASKFSEYHPHVKNEKGHKAGVWFELKEQELFAFAGIWRKFEGKLKGQYLEFNTYSIVTTTANSIVKPIHASRMPVILEPDDYDLWLEDDVTTAIKLIKEFPSTSMKISKIGSNKDD